MRKLTLLLFFLILLVFSVSGVKISNSQLELEVHEQNGRFSVFALDEKGKKTSLLVAEDPRTTMLTVLAGSKIYRMGDSFEFRQTVSSTATTAEIIWKSASLEVTQSFSLNGSSVLLTVSVKNVSEQDLNVGIRYLLDTYLGEKGEHFSADGLAVESETDYSWVAPYELRSTDGKDTSLYVLLSGDGITDPDRVVVANWKRLNDASWTFEASQSRDFSLLPYSINDSAIALYFEPQTVPTSLVRTASFKLDWRKAGIAYSSGGSTPEAGGQDINSELVDDLLDEVVSIDTLLLRIDKLLSADDEPNDAEIAEIKRTIEVLLERKKEFAEQQ